MGNHTMITMEKRHCSFGIQGLILTVDAYMLMSIMCDVVSVQLDSSL